jgi:hypothetical protein
MIAGKRRFDPVGTTMSLLQIFVYLQLLDLVTTLLGFRLGAAEASPFIRILMFAGPAAGVALSKVLALALGGWCVYRRKLNLIRVVTYWYSGLVIWNLMILLTAPAKI